MKFRVQCVEIPKNKNRNPFRANIVWDKTRVREWEMECESENEVRRFFAEAQDAGIENVMGFRLESIVGVLE